MTNCVCGDPEEIHSYNDPRVCAKPSCGCWGFRAEAAPRPDYHQILSMFEKTEEKVKWLLENLPELRELPNHEFLFVYWQIVDRLPISNEVISNLTDYQAIERCKRLLVAENKEKYGPKSEELRNKKTLMEFVTQEYVTQRN